MRENNQMFTQASDEWETPQNLFDELKKEFNFEVDLAARPCNAKCKSFVTDINKVDEITISNNAFIWCNPPHSKITMFFEFRKKHNLRAVFLVYSRTDTKWFHEYVYNKPNVEIRFLKGRLKITYPPAFLTKGRGKEICAPAPSMLVIFRGD